MDDLIARLMRDAVREAETAVQPLFRACRSHEHLYRFFLGIGWDLRAALGVDLAALRDHVEAARRAIQSIQAATTQADEKAAALAIRDAFRDVVQRSRPLYDVLTAAAPMPVQDHVLQAFAEDLALHLVTLYVARRSPFAYRLGQMAGLVRAERATPLYTSPPDGRMVRFPVVRMMVRPDRLVLAALNPILNLLPIFADPDSALQRLQDRLEAEARAVLEAGGGSFSGLELRLAPTGLHVLGGRLPRPPANAAAVRLPLEASGNLALEIAPEGYGISWLAGDGDDGQVTLFERSGVRFFVPGRPASGATPPGLTLSEAAGQVALDLVGAIGIELPATILSGADNDAVRASATAHVHFRQGSPPTLGLDEIRLHGRFHLGGANGLLIEEAELVVGAIDWPLQPPTLADPLPCDLAMRGVLAFPGEDLKISVEARHEAGTWTLKSTGSARFPNGIELRPAGSRPVLEMTASPAAGLYRLDAAGEFRFPTDSGPAGLAARGHLLVRVQNGTPGIEELTLHGETTDWPIGPDLKIHRLAIGLGHAPGRITASLSAAIPFGNGFLLEILDELPTGLASSTITPGLTLDESNGVLNATIAAGMRLTFPPDVLTAADGSLPISVSASGVLALSSDGHTAPSLSSLSIGLSVPRLRLGGVDGVIIENAALRATDIDRLFGPTTAPFATIAVDGRLICPIEMASGELTFEVKGAEFTFDKGFRALPSFGLADNGQLGVENATPDGFPLEVTKAALKTKQRLPLPDVLTPQNLVVTMSVALAADFSDIAAAVAGVENVTAEIADGRPRVRFEGLKFGVEDLQVPPMRFTGALGIHNLLDLPNVQLEGALGGTMQGATVKALVALRLDQAKPMPLGVCLDVNLGPAGIQVCYGFTVQGASGGMSFANTNADPCSFTTYSDEGRRIREASATRTATVGPRALATRPAPFSGCDCECPPHSMNILCQPHPDQDLFGGRAILKFSALEERMWADLPLPMPAGQATRLGDLLDGVDAEVRREIAARTGRFDAEASARRIAADVTSTLKSLVESLIPALDPATIQPRPPAEARAAFDGLAAAYREPAEHWAREMAGDLAREIGRRLQDLASGRTMPPLRKLVAAQLYRGVNCPDATVQVTGSFSYVGVSSFAYVTGGVNVSSAGSVGLLGILTVFGVPFGVLRAFVTGTDATGNLEPSFCGDLAFEMGPVKLGELCLEYKFPGLFTNFAEALGRFGGSLAAPLVERVLARMKREGLDFTTRPGFDLAQDVAGSLRRLTQAEASQFLASLLCEPALSASESKSVALLAAELARDLWNGFNPEITLCGEVAPEVFGIRLASLAQAKAVITKDRVAAEFSFSPLYIIGRFCPVADMFSGMDRAAVGISLAFPTIEGLVTEGLVAHLSGSSSLEQVIEDGVARTLRDTTMTFSYQFFPLGMRLLDGQGRIVLPYLTPHPAAIGSHWRNPDVTAPGAPTPGPTRRQALFAALDANRLRDVTWDGTLSDVMTLPAGQDLELQRDYFPHGGILGAGRLLVPRLLWDAPPVALIRETLDTNDWAVRLRNLVTLVKDWVLATRDAGALAFYMPAPNPPGALINQPDVSASALAEAMRTAAPEILYPDGSFRQGPRLALELSFFEGVAKGQVLGLQVGEADIAFSPATAAHPVSSMNLSLRLAQDPRLAAWVDPTAVTLSLSQGAAAAAQSPAERQTLDERFTALLHRLEERQQASASAATASLASVRALVESALHQMADYLPKASLTASIGLRTPAELAPWLGVGSASAELQAYSPFYEPNPAAQTALERIKHAGGWWIRGQLRFRFGDLLRLTTWITGTFELAGNAARPARLLGEASVSAVDAFTFLGATVQMANARLSVDTAAADGQSVLALKAQCGPLAFGPARLEPLSGPSLAVELQSRRTPAGATIALRLQQARLRLPYVDDSTPLVVTGDAGQPTIELGSSGGALRVVAASGLKLKAPNGSVALELAGPIQGRLALGATLPSLTLTLPQGITVIVLPGDATLRRSLALPATTTLLVKADGTFALQTALPALSMAGGLFTMHGTADVAAPLPVMVTEREVRLNGNASLSLQLPAAPRSTAALDTLVVGHDGRLDARGRNLAIRHRAAESSAGGFGLQRNGADIELAVTDVELKLAALPAFTQRWTVKVRPGAFEANLASGGVRTCDFGRRLSIGAADWRLRGGPQDLSLVATAPQLTLLGQPVHGVGSATLALGVSPAGPRTTASIALSEELRLLPDVLHLQPSTLTLDWAQAGGAVRVAGRLRALLKPDGSPGWVFERQVVLDLAQDTVSQLLPGAETLFSRPGLTIAAELRFGFDNGCFVGLDNVAANCLGTALPRQALRLQNDGRFSFSASAAGAARVEPLALAHGGFGIEVDTRGRSVRLLPQQARLVIGGNNWPSASRALPGLSLGWTAGTGATVERSIEFAARDSQDRRVGPADVKLTGPRLTVALAIGGGTIAVKSSTLSATLITATSARRPDNGQPWASASLAISRSVALDGTVTLPLPALDPGSDPLRVLRDACIRSAEITTPVPPILRNRWTGAEVPGSRQAHDQAVAALNSAKDACRTRFPPAPAAIPATTTGSLALNDLLTLLPG